MVRRLVRAAQRLLPERRDGLVVLAYHLVGAGTDSPVDLPLQRFRDQLDELRRIARPVDLAAAVAALAAGRDPAGGDGGDEDGEANGGRRPAVAVTFDDAYGNFHDRAWPLLAERGVPATLFVPVAFVEGAGPPPLRGTGHLPPVSWTALREMTATGRLAVGSHTWSHPDLTRLPAARVDEELRRSRETLEDRLGRAVTAFCYPRGLWSPRLEPQVAGVYELAAIGGGRRTAVENLKPLRIARTSLRRDGPASLAPLLGAPVWLEEWAAERIRRWRR